MPIRMSPLALLIGSILLQQLPAPVQTRTASIQPQDRAPIVRGRVVDGVSGRPVGRARVEISIGSTSRSTLASPRGEFEFRDAVEGSGGIRAEKSGYAAAWYPARKTNSMLFRRLELARGQIATVVVTMYRKPAISGTVADEYGDPIEGVSVQAWRISPYGGPLTVRGWASTNDIGEYRLNNLEPGRYVVAVVPSFSFRRDGDRVVPIYGLTFYPGAAGLDQAEAIQVGPGQSVPNANVSLLELTPTSVSGVVEDAGGQRVGGGGVTAFAVLGNLDFGRRVAVGGATITPDGTFSMRVPPGEYDFEAYTGGTVRETGWRYRAVARANVAAAGDTRVTLTAAALSTLTGRVVFESARKSPSAAPRGTLQITSPFEGGDDCRAATELDVKPDGTFTSTNVAGRCVLRSTGSDWTIKSILQGTNDLTDRVIEFRPGRDMPDVQIVLTERFTELVPQVSGHEGESTQDYVVLAFAADADRRGRYLEVSRFVGTFVPSVFERSPAGDALRARGLRGLPPGAYRVVALEDLSTDDARDPGFLEALVRYSMPVVLSEGERRVVQLRRITFPPEAPR